MFVLSLDLIKHTCMHKKSCKEFTVDTCNSSADLYIYIYIYYACALGKHILAIVNISCFLLNFNALPWEVRTNGDMSITVSNVNCFIVT